MRQQVRLLPGAPPGSSSPASLRMAIERAALADLEAQLGGRRIPAASIARLRDEAVPVAYARSGALAAVTGLAVRSRDLRTLPDSVGVLRHLRLLLLDGGDLT